MAKSLRGYQSDVEKAKCALKDLYDMLDNYDNQDIYRIAWLLEAICDKVLSIKNLVELNSEL